MDEIAEQRVSVAIHSVIAVIMGWVSAIVAPATRSLYAIIIGLVVLYAAGLAVEKIVGKKGFKWWAGNGLVIYLFLWFITWIFIFNMK
jgi:exosortase/archaeosortase